MGKKVSITPGVKARIDQELEDCATLEEETDLSISLHRAAQTRRDSAAAEMAYLEPIVAENMGKLGSTKRITKTRLSRSLGKLITPAKALSGRLAARKAAKIRRIAQPYLSAEDHKRLVRSTRRTTWSINEKLLKRLPADVQTEIFAVRGAGKTKVETGPTTKKARRGDHS